MKEDIAMVCCLAIGLATGFAIGFAAGTGKFSSPVASITLHSGAQLRGPITVENVQIVADDGATDITVSGVTVRSSTGLRF